jgi:hypothetical protein
MTNDSNILKFTSFEQFQEYYKITHSKSNDKEHNRYFQSGLEAAMLASETTLKALNLFKKAT